MLGKRDGDEKRMAGKEKTLAHLLLGEAGLENKDWSLYVKGRHPT